MNGLYERLEQVRIKAAEHPAICRMILKDRGVLYKTIQKPEFLTDLLAELRENGGEGSNLVWVESIINKTKIVLDRSRIKNQIGFIQDLLEMFETLKIRNEDRNFLLEELNPLFLSPGGRKFLEPIAPDELLEMIEKAENYCLNQLPLGLPDEESPEETL